ncbi:MFS general substrate transporter [Daedalea quercina L-15889]|uniref:MFS general substrate transporter n=1 Tax=Daedalea quercina L-15889 TaxID=1314783 RepID=A0A165TY65_9APHY|nr:MFS general substrate transporter [Daedalea quercina L-15889]
MTTEESPLLGHNVSAEADEAAYEEELQDDVYKRFTTKQKRMIVAVVSWTALIPLFVSESFVPTVPAVAKEFDSTGEIINLAVTFSMASAAITSMIWATYSGFYGRRPIYLACLPCLCIGSLGVAWCNSVPSLMLWRVLQAAGTSSGISVGAGVLGDIYKIEERGTAIGLFMGASLLGAAFAPLAGGIATHYSSWRDMQYGLFLAGAIALLLTYAYLPETSHPGARGIDKLYEHGDLEPGRFKWVWLNPFRSLALLKSPNLVLITLASTAGLMTDFTLLIPLPYTIGKRYNIENEALVGACFVALGVGNILGAPLAGRLSDKTVVRWRKRRGGEWVPEDRLRAGLPALATLVPLSVLLFGFTAQYVDGRLGIALCLAWLFMNGIGVDLSLSPVNTYLVDIGRSRSAELMAVQKATRTLVVGTATSGILPLINHLGVSVTDALAAVIALLGFCCLWVTVRYGQRMRTWVDVGSAEN